MDKHNQLCTLNVKNIYEDKKSLFGYLIHQKNPKTAKKMLKFVQLTSAIRFRKKHMKLFD